MKRINIQEANEAITFASLAYDDSFVSEDIKSDSFENDFWIWYWDDALKTLTIAIRGTNDLKDFLKDISIIPKRLEGVGWVHRGFLAGAKNIVDKILGQVLNAKHNGMKVVLTGHSYGGDVAQVMQQILYNEHNLETDCISFGSARLWLPGAKIKGLHTRVHISGDPVTMLPFITGKLFRIFQHRETVNFELDEGGWISVSDHEIKTYENLLHELNLKDLQNEKLNQ